MKVRHFKSSAAFHKWLDTNHTRASELWVGFYRKDSGKGGITYREALDEALCYGWIDGVRKKVDDISYTNRFTPRKTKSIWSLVNTRRVKELIKARRMKPQGLSAFKARDPKKTREVYSSNYRTQTLGPTFENHFRKNRKAWTFFKAQAPGYQGTMNWWVMSAKREETCWTRLARLIEASSNSVKLGW